MEKRFAYEPIGGDFVTCPTSHAIALYNAGKQAAFDSYIRGIIAGDVLYLRTFYPYPLEGLTAGELRAKSKALLNLYKADLLEALSREYGYTPKNLVLNAENDLLQGKGLTFL